MDIYRSADIYDMRNLNLASLSEAAVKIALKSSESIEVAVFDTLDSTNSEAKRRCGDAKKPMLIIAKGQTNGRGRMGREFYSPTDTGLYMSLMYSPEHGFKDSVTVTSAAAVAVVRAIEALTDKKPLIKWVNDVYIGSKKVCGILTEAVTGLKTHIIVGIGINLTTREFPSELSKKAVSLMSEVDINVLAARVTDELLTLISELPKRTFLREYREKSAVIGRIVEFSKGGVTVSGKALDIDNDGGLTVETESGVETLSTGEISVKIKENR